MLWFKDAGGGQIWPAGRVADGEVPQQALDNGNL